MDPEQIFHGIVLSIFPNNAKLCGVGEEGFGFVGLITLILKLGGVDGLILATKSVSEANLGRNGGCDIL